MKNLVVVEVVLFTVFISATAMGAYFQDDFSMFSGWTYIAGSTGHFASSGTYAYLYDGKDIDGDCTATKPLDITLGPGNDFSFTMNLSSGGDMGSTCGWIAATLRDNSNKVVAQLSWHDVQAGTGFGGVDFYAENMTAIYRTAPSGGGTEYPTLSGNLTLSRSGSQWSAYVNGIQKGSILTLSPMLTATQIELSAGHWRSWNERDIYVDEIIVTPEPVTLCLLGMGGLFLQRRRRSAYSNGVGDNQLSVNS